MKEEAQDLVQSLEGEIGQLKQAIDELDKNPDLQVTSQLSAFYNKNKTTSASLVLCIYFWFLKMIL